MPKTTLKFKRALLMLLAAAVLLSVSGCTPFDSEYGTESKPDASSNEAKIDKADIKIPEIMSDDTVMPKFFDISLYDEENYADIYLSKKFKYDFTYAGTKLDVPSSYKYMTRDGWRLAEDDGFTVDSTVLAGKTVESAFINAYNNRIVAVFFNPSKSSRALKKCPIVKFIVPENVSHVSDSRYGQFWINGISNDSAITDIIQFWGAPSHFYAVSPDEYYLDYFLTEEDRRSGITVYINPTDDSVKAIEVSYY